MEKRIKEIIYYEIENTYRYEIDFFQKDILFGLIVSILEDKITIKSSSSGQIDQFLLMMTEATMMAERVKKRLKKNQR